MFNFDKNIFMDKVRKQGIEIDEYAENTFRLPNLFKNAPNIGVSCIYVASNNTMGITAIVPVSDKASSQIVAGVCNTMNSVARFHSVIQDGFMQGGMILDFSRINYTDDDDALENVAAFIVFFKQEFEKFGVQGYKYVSTGNINCLNQ